MPFKSEFRPRAWLDVMEIAESIATNDLQASERFIDSVDDAISSLRTFPDSHKVPGRTPESGSLSDRQVRDNETLRVITVKKFPNYLVYDIVLDNVVEIVRVLHGARNINSNPLD